jgi:hypothetical protein
MKTLFYLLVAAVAFFFYWALLPKFDDIRACFFTAGLLFVGLGAVEAVPHKE